MAVATWKIPFMGLLGIFFVTIMANSEDTTIGYDCDINPVNMTRDLPLPPKPDNEFSSVNTRVSLFCQDYPDECAYRSMKDFGYRAIEKRPYYRIYECTPVRVKLISQTKCYNQLPIERNGQNEFLNPWTRTITKRVYEMPCDSEFLVDFKIEGRTYKVVPTPVFEQNFYYVKSIPSLKWEMHTLEAPTTFKPQTEDVLVLTEWNTMEVKHYRDAVPYHLDFVDDIGNKYGSKNPNLPPREWYQYWNTYSILIICGLILGVILCGIVITLFVRKFIHGCPRDSI